MHVYLARAVGFDAKFQTACLREASIACKHNVGTRARISAGVLIFMSCCQKELSCMSDRTPTCIISHARSKARQDGFNIKLVYVNQKSEGQASNMRSVEFKLGGG